MPIEGKPQSAAHVDTRHTGFTALDNCMRDISHRCPFPRGKQWCFGRFLQGGTEATHRLTYDTQLTLGFDPVLHIVSIGRASCEVQFIGSFCYRGLRRRGMRCSYRVRNGCVRCIRRCPFQRDGRCFYHCFYLDFGCRRGARFCRKCCAYFRRCRRRRFHGPFCNFVWYRFASCFWCCFCRFCFSFCCLRHD